MANRGVKMSLGDFIGEERRQPGQPLPTAPKERAPDDDGRFQRRDQRRSNRDDYEPSRSEASDNWRRGGGGGFDDSRGGGGSGYDRGGDRGGYDRGGYDRGGDRGGYDRGGYDRGGDRRGGYEDRGGGYGDRRGGYEDRGGGGSRFGGRDDRGGGGYDRFDRGSDGPPPGERPGIKLKPRTAPVSQPASTSAGSSAAKKSDPFGGASAVDTASKLEKLDLKESKSEEVKEPEPKESAAEPSEEPAKAEGTPADGEKSEKKEQKRREPEKVNPRAAALEAAPTPARRDPGRDRHREGPVPVASSRFAAAAEADRSHRDHDRRDDRGPPPPASSRFAAAAEADQSYRSAGPRDDRGPPPVAKSRFAAAAALAEEEDRERQERRSERDHFYGRGDDRMDDRGRGDRMDDRGRASPPRNSRFAAAAEADPDYVDRDERHRQMQERDQRGRDEGPSGRYQDDRGYGGRDNYDRGGGGAGYGRDDRGGYEPAPRRNRVDDLLKPKAPPAMDNVLKPPEKLDAAHADNILQMPTKSLSKDEEDEAPPSKKEEPPKIEEPAEEAVEAKVDTANQAELLAEFASGNKQGDDLKQWVEEHRAQLPAVKKLVSEMLTEREKLNPDVDCKWAEPDKFGAALLSLVQDDIVNQMQVLYGIQLYCDELGFPKLNEEYVVQSMFRSMYKYDLAEADAFLEWKEDESDEHAQGKMKALVQTLDWFNWLEEDDEEEEEYEEEGYEEE